MPSVDGMLRRSGGVAAGVPALRHAIALGILLTGSIEVSESFATIRQGTLGVAFIVLPAMLFALLGFLLGGSLERRSALSLLRRRAVRLLPAFGVSLVLTVLVCGFAFSGERPARFFTAPDTLQYFANLIGWTSNRLPGVFDLNNATGSVNRPLWMVPIVYLSVFVAVVLAWPRPLVRRIALAALFVGVLGVAIAFDQSVLDSYAVPRVYRSLLGPVGFASVAGLLLGLLAWQFRQRLTFRTSMFVLAALVLGVTGLLFRDMIENGTAGVLIAVPAAYLSVYLASSRMIAAPLLSRVNYSYGILLYGYPVQQAVISLFGGGQSWIVNFAISLPVTVALAAASWHGIERPLTRRVSGPEVVAAPADVAPMRPVLRPIGWYVRRTRSALPGIALILAFVLLILGALAVANFAMQRDVPGM